MGSGLDPAREKPGMWGGWGRYDTIVRCITQGHFFIFISLRYPFFSLFFPSIQLKGMSLG